MVFSSLFFLFVFLPIFLLGYFLLPKKFRNYYALLASLIFYGWGASDLLLFFVFSVIVDYILAILIYKTKFKKAWLTTSIVFNLGTLIYYKYSNFAFENINNFLGSIGYEQISWDPVILHAGISFFTFHKISYVVDIYRKKTQPMFNIADFGLYISLFPQLIAGPIVRFHEVSHQLKNRVHSLDNFYGGMNRFCIGLAKKVILANSAGRIADEVFGMTGSSDLTSGIAWVGIIAYSFQIYFDFSGYSDMAIGMAKMIGFKFPENFDKPYTAKSITEFWRRWHITLGAFFREYVYIPLGGNRKGIFRTYLNLWIIFFLSGLWHGANWTFIVWGAYHGLLLVIERAFLGKYIQKITPLITNIYAYFMILIGWVIFRSDSISNSMLYIQAMFNFDSWVNPMDVLISLDSKSVILLCLAAFFSFYRSDYKLFSRLTVKAGGVVSIVLLLYSIITLSNTSYNPFIYFQF
ncbi:Peptidoglycan O-acetyltransferase [compost metagenome]